MGIEGSSDLLPPPAPNSRGRSVTPKDWGARGRDPSQSTPWGGGRAGRAGLGPWTTRLYAKHLPAVGGAKRGGGGSMGMQHPPQSSLPGSDLGVPMSLDASSGKGGCPGGDPAHGGCGGHLVSMGATGASHPMLGRWGVAARWGLDGRSRWGSRWPDIQGADGEADRRDAGGRWGGRRTDRQMGADGRADGGVDGAQMEERTDGRTGVHIPLGQCRSCGAGAASV